MATQIEPKPNRLINEKSPYLQQHAFNPIDWFSWGQEAVQKAKRENKPILLSIGYSACHWCHVMEKESFEDEEIAKILNENFVSIKVDREERPDLDEVYMKAVQAMTGQGGWPLTAFLTPDLKPFFGGTYFPPRSRHGLPGFKDILLALARAWRERPSDLETTGSQVIEAIKESYSPKTAEVQIEGGVLESAYGQLVMEFDEAHGGFGATPKFPMPSYIFFLLRYHHLKGDAVALRMASKTLQAMARGGIYDQLAGGFHRYATDRVWLVPHFEKMLYDNALLAKAYVEAYQLTKDPYFARIATETIDWALREMRDPGGGFYSAIDADSEGEEGAYYSWTESEVKNLLGEGDANLVSKYYGVTQSGNFEHGKNLLHISREPAAIAAEVGLHREQVEAILVSARQKLLEHRSRRPRPLTDDKVLTSWNGLMISALATAYQVLGERRYLEAAHAAASFILDKMQQKDRLLRRYRDGEAAIVGTLEDYAYLTMGLLDLYEATFEHRWLREAIRLNQDTIGFFWDEKGGGFFFTPKGENELSVRVKEAYDGSTPSGNSIATQNLLRIAELTSNEVLRQTAERGIKAFWTNIERAPTAYSQMLTAIYFYLARPKEIAIAGDPEAQETQKLIREIHRHYLPNKVLALASGEQFDSGLIPFLEGKKPVNGRPAVYICESYTCKAPITDLEPLRGALSTRA